MNRPAVARRAVWASVVLMALLACSGSGSEADVTSPTIVAPPDGVVEILTQRGGGAGAQALNTFVLEYDADRNCLYSLEEDNNGEPGTGGRIVVVWPEGYTAQSHGDSVTVFDSDGAAVARTGVPFTLAGGAAPAPADHCEAIGAWEASGVPAPVLSD